MKNVQKPKMQVVDKFKETFRNYKNCRDYEVFNDFKEIFDPNRAEEFINNNLVVRRSVSELHQQYNRSSILNPGEENYRLNCQPLFGLIHPSRWEVYEFNFPKGLIFLKNPFTPGGQRYWISKCLTDYPQKPHITNIENLKRLKKESTNGNKTPAEEVRNDQFYQDLRWVTFGYHHCWDSKVYSESNRCKFPSDLACLTKYMSIVLGYKDFEAEAAIVNYYHLDSTLAGHVDRSEKNQYAPLFSLSFGQNCLFLIGAETKDTKPLAVYLKSGDVVVMTGPSRLSYHGVPKILPASDQPWNEPVELKAASQKSQDMSEENQNTSFPSKKLKLDDDHDASPSCSCPLCNFVVLSEFSDCDSNVKKTVNQLSSFHDSYISKSRINLNVRQVLFPGQKTLDDQNFIATVS